MDYALVKTFKGSKEFFDIFSLVRHFFKRAKNEMNWQASADCEDIMANMIVGYRLQQALSVRKEIIN